MTDERHLEELQLRFAAHLRDPATSPAPEGIEERRLQVYRELFFDNISSSLAGTFPVLHGILGPERWATLVRDFYRDHRCHTPLFLEIPREFVDYLGDAREARHDDPPFLYELAHYEWVELALAIDEQDLAMVSADPAGDLLEGVPVLSPLAWPLAYRWPVHRLSPSYTPEAPADVPTFLVVYRDSEGNVRFLETDAATARLLELLDAHVDETGGQVLARVAGELGSGEATARGTAMLAELRERGILLGTRR